MSPPPPPAPPPPPLFKSSGASNNHGKTNNFEPAADRNALLSQIRKGARLKKAETNDRSVPLVAGAKSSNGTAKQNNESKSNAPFPIIPPGGLFAQGIPKLRPTVSKSGDNPALSSLVIQSLKTGKTTSSLDHLRVGQLGGSRSQPPSPVSKPRMPAGIAFSRTAENHENAHSGNPNFPDDINVKGPAPAPPPASQKPVFRTSTTQDNGSDASNKLTTVKRSASQTNLGQRPRLTRPPPNVKPPPPPKICAPPQTAPPPPPSKPPSILRRQSFGVGEGHNMRLTANKLTVSSQSVSKATGKNIGPPPPPPPPRNNSAPHDLNQMVTGTSTNSTNNQWSKMNIAPPPPPPNRIVASGNRVAPIRPPPPRAPAPPAPPQHQFSSHPAPPSQVKATPSASMAPPPPTRVSSMKQTCDFEDRFKFHSAQSLPKPERFPNTPKSYPSKANQSRQKQNTRRQPPPPPPQSAPGVSDSVSRGQPVLHIQLESGIFSNNFAHS